MGFFDQVLHEQEEGVTPDEHVARYVDDLAILRAVTPHPNDPDWDATAYFNPDRYPDPFSQERVTSFYAEHYPGRRFRFVALKVSSLENNSPFLTKTAELTFQNRGFCADIESATYASGVRNEIRVQNRLMQAACGLQLAIIAAFYRGEEKVETIWRRTLEHLMGGATFPVPLVSEHNVYWPRREFPEPAKIHFAYSNKFAVALKAGKADEFGLTRATDREIAAQTAFEVSRCPTLFNGASREALFLWQTQVLAILRKATWNMSLPAAPEFRRKMASHAVERRDLLRRVTREGMAAYDPDAVALSNPSVQSIAEMAQAYLDDLMGRRNGRYGPGLGLSELTHELDTSEMLVAAMHGSTYCPSFDPENEFDRNDPLYALFPLACWLGRLKRHRFVHLDQGIASLILSVASLVDDEETTSGIRCYKPFFRERFGDGSWDAIVEAANEAIRLEQPIPIRYDWTSDPHRARSFEFREQGLRLVGPLLDFPLRDAAIWNRRSRDLLDRLKLPGWV